MTKDSDILQFKPGKKHFYLAAAIMAVAMLFLALGAAINIDEILHNNQAKKVVNWYASLGSDTSCLETPISNLKYYGQSPDNISAVINRVFSIENEFLTRHLVGFIFSFLLILFTGLLAIEISGNYFIGIMALILMFISPQIMGQAYGNLKDIPFAMGYVWSLLMMIRVIKEMPTPGWKNIIILALAIAFTNSVRIGGLIFFPFLIMFLIAWFLINKNIYKEILAQHSFWKKIVLKGIAIVLIGYFAGLIFWPFGIINPLKNPMEALSAMEHYKISIKQIFEGIQVWSTNLPWYYLPKWMLVSIPEIVIIGFILFALFFYKLIKEKNRDSLFINGMVIFAFVFPLVYVIAINSNLYSGWRQMYFIYAPMIVVSSIGLVHFFKSLKKRNYQVSFLLSAILILLPIIHTARNYPSEYIYFNGFAGFGKNALGNYEYDYYWHEMKKAATWLEVELKDSDKNITVASNFDITSYLYDKKNVEFKYVHFYDKISVDWDYAILGVNYVHPYQLKNNSWQPEGVVKTFYHNGNPTVIILKGQDKKAYNGYSAFLNNNFPLAVNLLSKAQKKDSTDLNILAYLGECYLALNNYPEVLNVIQDGKKLHPFYEPFLLLDAKLEMKQGNFENGLVLLKNLIKENPRYFKALPYLIECYEKTGNQNKAKQLRIKYNI